MPTRGLAPFNDFMYSTVMGIRQESGSKKITASQPPKIIIHKKPGAVNAQLKIIKIFAAICKPDSSCLFVNADWSSLEHPQAGQKNASSLNCAPQCLQYFILLSSVDFLKCIRIILDKISSVKTFCVVKRVKFFYG